MEFFSKIEQAPPDPIFNLTTSFKEDNDPKKVNLGVGAYRDNSGKPLVLESVKKAEAMILNDPQKYNHEYLGIDGNRDFCKAAAQLLLGQEFLQTNSNRVYMNPYLMTSLLLFEQRSNNILFLTNA